MKDTERLLTHNQRVDLLASPNPLELPIQCLGWGFRIAVVIFVHKLHLSRLYGIFQRGPVEESERQEGCAQAGTSRG